jgi:peptidoglycan/LPS O-acetylase OafA/YrhL
MRRYYIDNLRWICILLLFPYHAAMVFNCWGEGFYVRGVSSEAISAFIIATYTWFMPLLFTLAGASSYFALQKRTAGDYAKERVKKLLVPLMLGILLIVPAQTYFAERMHNGYTGGYFAQYRLFFTKFGDLSGYTGGFTVGHLWFLLYLFVISLIALPLMRWYLRREKKIDSARFPLALLFALVLIPVLLSPISIAGKSLGLYLGLFLLGFFLLSQDGIVERLSRLALPLVCASALLIAAKLVLYFVLNLRTGLASDLFDALVMWATILALFGAGKRWLNGTSPVSRWLAASSFSIYILHQSVLVAVGFYVLKLVHKAGWQFLLIALVSLPLTLVAVWLVSRVPYLRMVLGIYEPAQTKGETTAP